MLLSANQWDVLRKKSLKSEKYILLYLLRYAFEPCPYIYDVLKYYQDKLQCKIIALEGYEGHDPYVKNLKIEDATESTISEFLDYFAQASLVVTSSFHGTAFAIMFNRQFVEVLPKEKIARNLSVLKQFGLEDRILNSLGDFSYINQKIDYLVVNKKLKESQELAAQKLKEMMDEV